MYNGRCFWSVQKRLFSAQIKWKCNGIDIQLYFRLYTRYRLRHHILPAVASPPKRVFSRFTVSSDQFDSVMKFRKQNRSVHADASYTVRNYSGFVSIYSVPSSVRRFCFQFESDDAITFCEMSLRSFVEISCVHNGNAEFGCFCRKWFVCEK